MVIPDMACPPMCDLWWFHQMGFPALHVQEHTEAIGSRVPVFYPPFSQTYQYEGELKGHGLLHKQFNISFLINKLKFY